jgi:ankyrin repeat protein
MRLFINKLMNGIETSNSSYKTAAEILNLYINNANLEAGYALMKDGEVNLEIKNKVGMTPLHQAVKNDNLSYTNLLLDFGADPNSRKEFSLGYETPLLIAAENNYLEIAKLLLDFGADPTAKNSSGLNCLHLAAKSGCLEMCILLISRGCDQNIRDDFGNNASFWAKKGNHLELLQFLPPPLTVTDKDNKEHRDMVDEFRLLLTADDKKKMAAKKGKK